MIYYCFFIIKKKIDSARLGVSKQTLPLQKPRPHSTKPQKEGETARI